MTVQKAVPGWVYAGFWLRVWASLVDSVLMAILLIPLGLAIGPLSIESGPNSSFNPLDFVFGVITPAVATVLFWVYKSATPGKMLIKARIVDSRTGKPASPRQSIIRYFANYLSLIPMGLGYVRIAWSPRKQAWHDLLAGTVVIRQGNSILEPVRFEQPSEANSSHELTHP